MQKAIDCGGNKKKRVTKPQPSIIEAGYNESDQCFNIMFVRYDDERSMEVVESSVIDFNRVIEYLEEGNSVFIAPKRNKTKTQKSQKTQKYYVSHV